jgi:hypothetical protein
MEKLKRGTTDRKFNGSVALKNASQNSGRKRQINLRSLPPIQSVSLLNNALPPIFSLKCDSDVRLNLPSKEARM